jgi:hypothetical protein
VSVDGEQVVSASFPPAGVWKDGNSIAIEHIAVTPGEHRVSVAIGDTIDPEVWSFDVEETVEFESGVRRVLAFDRVSGFSWH